MTKPLPVHAEVALKVVEACAHQPPAVHPLPVSLVPDLRKVGSHPDNWYPLARSKDLKKGQTLGRSFAGDPIVLVRTESDQVYALEDRCAHRQVPLHHGVVHGEHLQCGYHCWTFDRTGSCVGVPYLSKGQARPKGVRSYPCREAYGLIFVFPGNIEKLTDTVFPEVSLADDQKYKTRFLNRRVNCHYSFMHENLMDMNHQFLHRRLMGGIRTTCLELRERDHVVEVDYTFSRVKGSQPLGEKLILGNPQHVQAGPEHDLMTICTDYPYQTLKFWTAGSTEPALNLWNVYVPIDREQCQNHTFGLMMIRKPSFPGLIHLLWPCIVWFTERIFAEDRWIVEEEQKAFNRQGADWNQEVFPVIERLRALLRREGVVLQGCASDTERFRTSSY
ncbi:MAG: aromatic ring-hydroxylating dioxygenase subunit alpha [Nitrospirales bacterium]|nr:aromatic ring-hydroxylating dioxygenase subunit alpha [Nitrospira sp.]MDR4501069.1 aromatic ring-hydroxylating dioxygenase subunit alpha [Nitrospirales bacterium]